MSIHLQPPVPLVTLVKTEPPTVIKNEPPEEALEEEISTDMKYIDIVYHPLSEDLIKSERVLEDILESKHLESVQTKALVKAENSPFIKTENITQRNNSENTSDGNVSRGTGQGVVEVQEIDEQSVINFSKDLNTISVRNRKSESSKKADFVECYKTDDTTLWEKEKEKIKVIKANVIPVEAHEYSYLAKDKRVCNHCQQTYKNWKTLKIHIRTKHREVTTMYQCPYCPYKSKWQQYIINQHIIQKHKDTKDIQWFQCNLCEKKFKLKCQLTRHMKVHLRHKQMQDGLDLREKRHHCDKCEYKTERSTHLKMHKLNHLKPEDIPYFHCYHCSYKSKQKVHLQRHIFKHLKNEEVKFDCYICNFVTQKRESIIEHIKKHTKVQINFGINEGS